MHYYVQFYFCSFHWWFVFSSGYNICLLPCSNSSVLVLLKRTLFASINIWVPYIISRITIVIFFSAIIVIVILASTWLGVICRIIILYISNRCPVVVLNLAIGTVIALSVIKIVTPSEGIDLRQGHLRPGINDNSTICRKIHYRVYINVLSICSICHDPFQIPHRRVNNPIDT
jgi:hypothetical protein